MPKRTSTAVAALGVALALLLTGCAGTAPPPAGERTAPATTEPVATVPAGPVEVTTTPTPTPVVDEDAAAAAQWVTGVAKWFVTKGITITEAEVRAAAEYSCDQLDAGVAAADIVPLTGDVDPEVVSTFIANAPTYCARR